MTLIPSRRAASPAFALFAKDYAGNEPFCQAVAQIARLERIGDQIGPISISRERLREIDGLVSVFIVAFPSRAHALQRPRSETGGQFLCAFDVPLLRRLVAAGGGIGHASEG